MGSQLRLAVALAVAGGGIVCIERAHRVVIEPPAPVLAAAGAAVCPENDTLPYSASCLAFLGHGFAVRMTWAANAAERETAPSRGP